MLNKAIFNSQKILLIDAIGAFISFCSLLFIASQFSVDFGMTAKSLYFLAIIPAFFAIYSLLSYCFAGKKWAVLLAVIAIANVLYCCLTAILLFLFREEITIFGIIYFLFEIMVISVLVWFEFVCIKKSSS